MTGDQIALWSLIAAVVLGIGAIVIAIWAAQRRPKIKSAMATIDKTYLVTVTATAGRTPVGVTAVRAVISGEVGKEPSEQAEAIDPPFKTTFASGLNFDSTGTQKVDIALYDPNEKIPETAPPRDRIWVRIDYGGGKKFEKFLVPTTVLPDEEVTG